MAKRRNIREAAALLGRRGGLVTSEAKAIAVRENGKLGGRPKKRITANTSTAK